MELGLEEYSICLARDISELTASITALAVKCAVTSAATGDSSQPVFWGAMALICLLGISMLLTAVRRKRGQRTE